MCSAVLVCVWYREDAILCSAVLVCVCYREDTKLVLAVVSAACGHLSLQEKRYEEACAKFTSAMQVLGFQARELTGLH